MTSLGVCMTQKKWADLTEFGSRLVVIPSTDQRQQVAIVKIENQAKFESSLRKPLEAVLSEIKKSNNFVQLNSETGYSGDNNSIYLMYNPGHTTSLSLKDLSQIFPINTAKHVTLQNVDDIYLVNNLSETQKNNWLGIFEVSKSINAQAYVVKNHNEYGNKSISKVYDDFSKQDHHWNQIPKLFNAVDPIPLKDLDNYGYTAAKSLVKYFVDKEAAVNAGYRSEQLEPYEITNPLVLSVNISGEVLALKDVTQIPELSNYDIDNHKVWSGYNSMPEMFVGLRELNKTIGTDLSNIAEGLNKESLTNIDVNASLTQLQSISNRLNDVLYSHDLNSVPHLVAPFGIQTTTISKDDGKWMLWNYNNQTLQVDDKELKDNLAEYLASIQKNVQTLQTYDPYGLSAEPLHQASLEELFSNIGNSLEEYPADFEVNPEVSADSDHIPPEPALSSKVAEFSAKKRFGVATPDAGNAIIRLIAIRRLHDAYTQKLLRIKEEREVLSAAHAKTQSSQFLHEKGLISGLDLDPDYILNSRAYDEKLADLSLFQSQLNIIAIRTKNFSEKLYNQLAMVNEAVDLNEIKTYVNNQAQELGGLDLEEQLKDLSGFEKIPSNEDFNVYAFKRSEDDQNKLWQKAVNDFDVLHTNELIGLKADVEQTDSPQYVGEYNKDSNIFFRPDAIYHQVSIDAMMADFSKRLTFVKESLEDVQLFSKTDVLAFNTTLNLAKNHIDALNSVTNNTAGKQFLSEVNLKRLDSLTGNSTDYKSFNVGMDYAHVLLEMTANFKAYNSVANIKPPEEIQAVEQLLHGAINKVVNEAYLDQNVMAKGLLFVGNNKAVNLPEVLASHEAFYIDPKENYLPKVGLRADLENQGVDLLNSTTRKKAMNEAFQQYNIAFIDNAFSGASASDQLKAKEHYSHLPQSFTAAYNYMMPQPEELTVQSGATDIQHAMNAVDSASKVYIAQGNNLYFEEADLEERALSVLGTSSASESRYLRILPLSLTQSYLAVADSFPNLTDHNSVFQHGLSTSPISSGVVNAHTLGEKILQRILIRESAPKYESTLNETIRILPPSSMKMRFIPPSIPEQEHKTNGIGTILADNEILSKMGERNAFAVTQSNVSDIYSESLKRAITDKGAEYWDKAIQREINFNPSLLLKEIHHPEILKDFEFPNRVYHLAINPATEKDHGSIDIYNEAELLGKDAITIGSFTLKELLNEEVKRINSITPDELPKLIEDHTHMQVRIKIALAEHDKQILNPALVDYQEVSLYNENGVYKDSTKKYELQAFISNQNVVGQGDLDAALVDYIKLSLDENDLTEKYKIIVAQDGQDIALTVHGKDFDFINEGNVRVFDDLEQFQHFATQGLLRSSFEMSSIDSLLYENIKEDVGLDDNVLVSFEGPLDPKFKDFALPEVNKLIVNNITGHIGRCDKSISEKTSPLTSSVHALFAVRNATEDSPIQLAIIHPHQKSLYQDEGFKLIPNPSANDHYRPLKAIVNILAEQQLVKDIGQAFLPSHIKAADLVAEASNDVATPVEEDTTIKVTQAKTNERVIEDIGFKIPGAKKDLYGPRTSISQIEDMNLVQLQSLITLDKIWRKESALQAKEAGRDIYIHLLTDAVRKVVDTAPKISFKASTEQEVKKTCAAYYDVVVSIRDALLESKTLRDFETKALDLSNRIKADDRLTNSLNSFSSAAPRSLIEAYSGHAAKKEKLQEQLYFANDIVKLSIKENLAELEGELPQLQYAQAIFKKVKSAVSAKLFQAKLDDVSFNREQLGGRSIFVAVDPALSEKVMNQLTEKPAKTAKNTEEAVVEVEQSEKSFAQIMSESEKGLDATFKSAISKRNMRETLKASDVVVTGNVATRNGRDINAYELQATFGLKAVEFGEYLNQKDRQANLNFAYDGCYALTKALNIEPKMVGLNGMLGLAFGSRGRSKAMAHYEPSHRVINLTKNSGYGTFAHEYFHAVDHLVFDALVKDDPAYYGANTRPYITNLVNYSKEDDSKLKPLNQDLIQKTRNVLDAMYSEPTGAHSSLADIEKTLNQQSQSYMKAVVSIIDHALPNNPDIADLFKKNLPDLKNRVKEYFDDRKDVKQGLNILINECEKSSNANEFQKNASSRNLYNKVSSTFMNLLNENDYPITRTEMKEYKANIKSEDPELRSTAALVLGAGNSTTFRTILYRDHRQLLRTELAIAALNYVKEQTKDLDVSEDHLKNIALTLQSDQRSRMLNLNKAVNTEFYMNATMLDSMTPAAKPYWTTPHEMFARSGEQFTQVKLAEENLRNDWLVTPNMSGTSAAVTQPHGPEKDRIITSIADLTTAAFEYVQEHIAELRFRDHKQYVTEAMHYFNAGTDQHKDLGDWRDKLNSMSLSEYEEYWDQHTAKILAKANLDLNAENEAKNKRPEPEFNLG